jgi:hypothetical protein
MKNVILKMLTLAMSAAWLISCNMDGLKSNSDSATPTTTVVLTNVAQTSSQLASGTSFTLSGSSSDSGGIRPDGMGGRKGPGGPGMIDGTGLFTATDELLAIVDAESAGDFRGFRMQAAGGATVTNYDASGNVVTLSPPAQNSGGPEGCSFSGKQFPKFDSLLAKVAKTVVDFGTGVTHQKGNTTITRAGKIIITRTGDSSSHTETITFDNYTVNGAAIAGTKTRVSTFDSTTGKGSSTTNVSGGKITFCDATVASWVSNRSRVSAITLDSNGRPTSGTITTEGSSTITSTTGDVIYSHKVTKAIIEDLSCRMHKPVSGTVQTTYHTDVVSIDFGDGSCSNTKATVTLNGQVVTAKVE